MSNLPTCLFTHYLKHRYTESPLPEQTLLQEANLPTNRAGQAVIISLGTHQGYMSLIQKQANIFFYLYRKTPKKYPLVQLYPLIFWIFFLFCQQSSFQHKIKVDLIENVGKCG